MSSFSRKKISMKPMHHSARAFLALLPLPLLIAGAATLRGATITVTNLADGGTGTLRAALASAANGDTIVFSLTTPAIISLTSGELLITHNVTLAGPGAANLAIDG